MTSSFLDCRVPSATIGGPPRPRPTGPPGWPGPGRPIIEVHHTSYIIVFPAADRTRSWMATYTVSASCPDECSRHHNPGAPNFIPPNFVVTTVACDVCAVRQQVITCPNALGVAPVTIQGDGITATAVVTDTPEMSLTAAVAAPTLPVARPVIDGEPDLEDPPLGTTSEDGDEAEDEGDDSFGPVGTLPVAPAPGAGSSRTLGSFSPVVTAAAPPRAINLKQGLTLFMGLGFAVGSLVLA